MGKAKRPIDDPLAAIATAGGRRSLEALVTGPSAHALPALVALLGQPPDEPKALGFLLAWAGRLGLGAQPTRAAPARSALRAVLDEHVAVLAAPLAHRDRRVRSAATVALAACHGHAPEVQRWFADRALESGHYEVASALRIASAVLARDTGAPGQLPAYPVRPGDPVYYADAIARQLDGGRATAAELSDARSIGERILSKLPWFPTPFPSVLRALVMERPAAEREATATALAAKGATVRALELVLLHRDALPRRDRAERLAATTFLRGDELTPIRRAVITAPPSGFIPWGAFRLPSTALGRAVLLGAADGPLAALVETSRGPTPIFVALSDLLAEATVDRWTAAQHRAAIEALVQHHDRAALDRAAKSCEELVDPAGFSWLLDGRPPQPAWPF